MNKALRLLVITGFCGLGMIILATILRLNYVGIIGLVMLFGSVAAVVACNVITGYNPVEP